MRACALGTGWSLKAGGWRRQHAAKLTSCHPGPTPPPLQLRTLLMDDDMRRVLQECSNPAAFRRYMTHPKYGPKIKRLADAGLVALQ